MFAYDKTFDPEVFLISRHSIGLLTNFFHTLFAYGKTFDPKVDLGHYDLISWFSDFPLYLNTQLVYEHTSFTICLCVTKPLTVKYSWVTDLIPWVSDFALYLDTQLVFFHTSF